MNQHLSAKQPASPSLPQLFTPLALRGVTARNRVVVSPMSQYLAVDGEPGDWHLVHLGKFAMGGAGIVFVEETSVDERARKTYCCPGIYTDAQARAWRRITDFLRDQGALSAIQLGHAGRKVATKPPWEGFEPLTEDDARAGHPPWRGYAPSPIPFKPGAAIPIEERSAKEVTHLKGSQLTPGGARIWNPGFDVTPHPLIAGIITERGIFRAPYSESLKRAFEREEAAAR